MWRPRPVTTFTCPVARIALGTSAFTSVDLPTPECPTKTVECPISWAPMRSSGISSLRAREHLQIEALEVREELGRIGQVGLGHHEQRAHAGIQRRDEVAVDEALARLRVGGGDDDEHLVGVGDDDALDLVGVVGRSAQQRCALLDADDAGEGALGARPVADDPGAVAGDDLHAAQLARARGEHAALIGAVLVGQNGVTAAIDAEDARDHGVGVRRPALGARAVRLGVGAGPQGRLVELRFVVLVVFEPAHRVRTTSGSHVVQGLGVRVVVGRAGEHLLPELRELGHRLGGGADVVDLDALDGEADEGAGRGEAVVVVRAPGAAVQGAGHDADAVGQLVGFAAEARAAR